MPGLPLYGLHQDFERLKRNEEDRKRAWQRCLFGSLRMCTALLLAVLALVVPPRLHVEGNKVKDPNGNVVILRGVALIDLGFLQEAW